jgi:hypothetical protein
MKAYVVRNRDGSITKGWLLRQGTSIRSSMCRLPRVPAEEDDVEEVPVEVAVCGAGGRDPRGPAGRPRAEEQSSTDTGQRVRPPA